MNYPNVLSQIKVLYVEDDKLTRLKTSQFLKKQVGKLIVAENGQDALIKYHLFKPDVVITDLVMPEIGGIEFLETLRSENERCRVLITSSLCDVEILLHSVELKIDKYLVKPVDDATLIHSLLQVTVDLFENNKDTVVVKNQMILSAENKVAYETEIRNICANYLKLKFGKGAKSINVFIESKTIEIIFNDVLTTMESSVLSLGPHHKAIEILRRLIYDSTLHQIESQISELIGRRVLTERVEINPNRNFDRLIIKIFPTSKPMWQPE